MSTFTDMYGRTVTSGSGNVWTIAGDDGTSATITASSQSEALTRANSMAPADYVPPSPTLTLVEQAEACLACGLMIMSTGTPAIDGTYACDKASQGTIGLVVASINAGQGFPGGGSTFNFSLLDGSMVTFPSTALFIAVAVAIRDFVYAIDQVITGQSSSLPASSVEIA